MDTPQDVDAIYEVNRRRFLQYIAAFGVILAVTWPVFQYLTSAPVTLVFNFLMAIISGAIFLYARSARPIGIVYWVYVFALFFLGLGINANYSEFSFATAFPLVAIFLLGIRFGILWIGLYGIALAIALVYQLLGPAVSWAVIFRVEAAVIFATLILYFYQDSANKAQSLVKKRQQELSETIEQINQQKAELQRLNSLMIGRELAMTELKQKLKELEEKLQR